MSEQKALPSDNRQAVEASKKWGVSWLDNERRVLTLKSGPLLPAPRTMYQGVSAVVVAATDLVNSETDERIGSLFLREQPLGTWRMLSDAISERVAKPPEDRQTGGKEMPSDLREKAVQASAKHGVSWVSESGSVHEAKPRATSAVVGDLPKDEPLPCQIRLEDAQTNEQIGTMFVCKDLLADWLAVFR